MLSDAAALMVEKNVSAVAIVRGQRLIGILTDKDLLWALAELLGHHPTTIERAAALFLNPTLRTFISELNSVGI